MATLQKIDSSKRLQYILYTLALLNIVIHLAFHANLEYHRDEFLYFSLGMHPAFGYASVPPLISWIATVMQTVFGFNLMSVKLFPAVLSGVFLLLNCGVTRELGGKSYAQILTAIAVLVMPMTLRTFHLYQPVCIDLFFWTLLFYLVLRYVNTENDKYLIYLGATFGLAMLNKYLVAILLPAFLLPVAFTKHRNVFQKRNFYIGLGAGLLIFSPNLIWQIVNGLPVITHITELNETQLVNVNRLNFIKDQFLAPFLASLLFIPAFIFLWRRKQYQFLIGSVLFVFIVLMLLQAKSYYAMGLRPFLIAAGAVGVEHFFKNRIPRVAIALFILIGTLPVTPIGIPMYKQDRLVQYFKHMEEQYGLVEGRRFEDGSIHSLPQDYADQLGWAELTTVTAKAYNSIPDKDKVIILCENYGQAGAIDIIGKQYDLPRAYSFSDSYQYWNPPHFDPDIEYVIFINDEMWNGLGSVFADKKVYGQINNINAREYGTKVYILSNPNSSFNAYWKDVLIEVSGD